MSRKTNREYESEVLVGRDIAPTPRECEELRTAFQRIFCGSWSTWSAVINRTSRAGELRSAPSGPDDWHRVAGKRPCTFLVEMLEGVLCGAGRSQASSEGRRTLTLLGCRARRRLRHDGRVEEVLTRFYLEFFYPLRLGTRM